MALGGEISVNRLFWGDIHLWQNLVKRVLHSLYDLHDLLGERFFVTRQHIFY